MSNELLKQAVEARIPVIGITTRDTASIKYIVAYITGRTVSPDTTIKEGALIVSKSIPPSRELRASLLKNKATAVVVNSTEKEKNSFVLDIGDISTPRGMMVEILNAVVKNEAKATALAASMSGLTIREANDYIRLTMSRDKSLTTAGLNRTRKSVFSGAQGLTIEDTDQDFYVPPPDFAEFVASEKNVFHSATIDHRLVPRGIMADGPPGTGKSSGAKYLAKEWGVPLFRIDLGRTQQKYVGNSEANLAASFSRLDNEEPCVVLLDEIEKVLARNTSNEGEATGVKSGMEAMLLWWLQEHRSRVFTFMTTNKLSALPPELFRPGRIDRVIWFDGLLRSQAVPFITSVAASFKVKVSPIKAVEIATAAFKGVPTEGRVPHAAISAHVYQFVKSQFTGT